MKYTKFAALLMVFTCYTAFGQNKSESQVPGKMVRAIRQDKKGDIWLAGAEGIIKYDGKSFTNVTTKQMKSARFFSALEDRKGNLWFAAVGSGVYHYNGSSFKNYTTKDGLISDLVTNSYEDKTGGIWFGTEQGASRYDGKTFRGFKMNEGASGPDGGGDSAHVSGYQQDNDVNAIVEDNTGKFWFGTRGNTFNYDGKTFTLITKQDGKGFTNVRSIIKDSKGNIWLGGNDGLWRYDGKVFTNITQKFVGNIMEDKKGNIWTSSESALNRNWALTRYDQNTLSEQKPAATEVLSIKGMLFGILEANDGGIWVGALNGAYRYDGKNTTDFK